MGFVHSSFNEENYSNYVIGVSLLLFILALTCVSLCLQVVIFCFSKNHCDKLADGMSGIDLTSSSEKSEIRVFCDKAFSRLKGSDRNLPQVCWLQIDLFLSKNHFDFIHIKLM